MQGLMIEKKRLVNGYRRFDPQRGMEYILDLELNVLVEKENEQIEISHRVNLLRPLSQVRQFILRTGDVIRLVYAVILPSIPALDCQKSCLRLSEQASERPRACRERGAGRCPRESNAGGIQKVQIKEITSTSSYCKAASTCCMDLMGTYPRGVCKSK